MTDEPQQPQPDPDDRAALRVAGATEQLGCTPTAELPLIYIEDPETGEITTVVDCRPLYE
ncbi:hypothetical protein IU510_30360 [Nocardia cyriacigeorgica]|uniref:hypothetical protein n=1 Tax=Nocardia cyriacigeorgica TaxID=135487 RepID=UPI0018954FB5|nr:hypothetical protein [Nocardia cyriacigeorgica]MBF6102325.1 hypothetical protein [Nocardia cyriacigeorgica]MBF6162168.1 hypothetical protein [Nocardia cyriacigeorgica]MBF6200770.1 hypothetical protein [Nocardia cyriacigeorgica]MBF6518031.1 hypothetical protein [Nocardia cyriacigeorgica]